MKAAIVCFTVTGKNGQFAKALDQALAARGVTTERIFLQPKRRLGVFGAMLLSLLGREVDLVAVPEITDHDLLALVGPVWASSVNPPMRRFLRSLKDLSRCAAINVVCGYNPHQSVVYEINRQLKKNHCTRITSAPIRLRDIETAEKMAEVAQQIVQEALDDPGVAAKDFRK